jgi:hypothetical protein
MVCHQISCEDVEDARTVELDADEERFAQLGSGNVFALKI